MPFSSWHVLNKSLASVDNVGFKKEFTDDIEVLQIPEENLGNIRPYVLLYVKYAYMYACVTSHVCYLWYYM